MKNFEKALENLTSFIQAYDDSSLNDGENLNYLLQKITTTLFYLDVEREKYKREYDKIIHNLTTDKKLSVARAVNFADVEVPEVYLLRKITESGYRISDAIRTNISFLKNERNNSK